ncbi:MAG TPA: thioredoxin domain-containing protein [Streptosporangiaceae bacterium]|nr:thioredoxin domain-containing protein [Streptosporangiaceae bacterium]
MEAFTTPRLTEYDHVRGPADAPVTVLEYGDFECPYCRGAFRDVRLLVDQHPAEIRFVFRNFPIPELHPHAEQAAEAAEAAAAQGNYWAMHDLLLQPYSHLDVDSLVTYAEAIGLDIPRFRRDLTDRAYAARIERDIEEGTRNGVNATPKFYVDGQRVDGKVPLENLVTMVESAVSAARGQSARGQSATERQR